MGVRADACWGCTPASHALGRLGEFRPRACLWVVAWVGGPEGGTLQPESVTRVVGAFPVAGGIVVVGVVRWEAALRAAGGHCLAQRQVYVGRAVTAGSNRSTQYLVRSR